MNGLFRRKATYWCNRILHWGFRDRPSRMLQGEKQIDEPVAEIECLYMRFRTSDLKADGKLASAAIRFPDHSVNRSKYAEPSDLLIADPDVPKSTDWIIQGVYSFPASLAFHSFDTASAASPVRQTRVEHDPLVRNYAHCEIRLYSGPNRISPAQQDETNLISKPERTRWRLRIYEGGRVVLRPLV